MTTLWITDGSRSLRGYIDVVDIRMCGHKTISVSSIPEVCSILTRLLEYGETFGTIHIDVCTVEIAYYLLEAAELPLLLTDPGTVIVTGPSINDYVVDRSCRILEESRGISVYKRLLPVPLAVCRWWILAIDLMSRVTRRASSILCYE
jgi:hypothetical protein